MTIPRSYDPCDWCRGTDQEVRVTTAHDDSICEDCVEQTFTCTVCGGLEHNDEMYLTPYGEGACETCFMDNFFHCDECGETYSNSDYGGEGMCDMCYDDYTSEDDYCDCGCQDNESSVGIRRWGDAPDLQFWTRHNDYTMTPKPNTYYMGMEIELEQAKHIVGENMNDSPFEEHMWATTDASLESNGGVEIVTHPHTFAAWNYSFPWKAWTKKIHDMVPNQTDWDSNGIHIHVSRTAFANSKGKPMASHLYKFMQFIQVNEAALQQLAGRNGNTYCKWDQSSDGISRLQDAKTKTSTKNYERYRPINTMNVDTIELRFFAGLSDPVFMKRSIQFVHSLVEFTRIGGFKSDRTWKAYTKYVRRYALRYPELVCYLNSEHGTLDTLALVSNKKYREVVLPNIKQRKQAQQLREQRDREAERQRLLDNEEARRNRESNPVVCPCNACTTDRSTAAFNETIASMTTTMSERLTAQEA